MVVSNRTTLYIRNPTVSIISNQYRRRMKKKVVYGFIHFLNSVFWKYLPVSIYIFGKKTLLRKTTICTTGLKCHRIIVQHTAYQIEQVQTLKSKSKTESSFVRIRCRILMHFVHLHRILACRTGRTLAFKNRHETKTWRRDETATIHFCTNGPNQMRMLIATDWLRAVPCTFGSLA